MQTEHLCWCYMIAENIINTTDTNNCKHCSNRVDCKKIEIFETDYINKTNNYWNCYLNDAVAVTVIT